MKTYIFITEDIHPIGGMQEYVSCKTEYLQKNGWNVKILFNGKNFGNCSIPFLNDYVEGGMQELNYPPFYWSYDIACNILNTIIEYLNIEPESEPIIESHFDRCAFWGELLAPRINASHFCFICNELFDGPGKHYKEYIDFFDFKHTRRELTAISPDSIPRLFDGYKTVSNTDIYVFKAAMKGTVQFVPTFHANNLKLGEWNICYIGRAKKGYVPYILSDLSEFVSKHQEHIVSFTAIGNMDAHKELIESSLSILPNLKINLLGDMVPIPQQLFNSIDVVVAGAGSALCSIQQGIPTIIADASNYKCNGFFGFDTNSIFYAESPSIQCSYLDALERYFIHDRIDRYSLPIIEPPSADDEFVKHFEFINSNTSPRDYYDFSNNCFTSVFAKHNIKYKTKKRFKNAYNLYRALLKK